MRVDCGATHKHLPAENFCREPVGHRGQHVAPDSQGRPEYVWTDGDVWDWAPVPAQAADNGQGGDLIDAMTEPVARQPKSVRRFTARLEPSPDPGEVERAARAIWGVAQDPDDAYPLTWEDDSDAERDYYRQAARAALAAVRPATDAEQKVARVEALAEEMDTDAREAARLGEVYKANERWAGVAALDAKEWTSKYAADRIRAALSGAHTEPKEQG